MSYDFWYLEEIMQHKDVESLKQWIIHHEVFGNIKTQKHMRIFMEHHVFQVWDFMILLKSIQFGINSIYRQWYDNFSCWYPKVPGKFSRLITEICLDEESDDALADLSHFEYYMKAMDQSEADMYYIEKALSYVRANIDSNPDLNDADFFPSQAVREHFLYMREVSNIVKSPEELLYKPLASFLCL